MGCGGDDDGTDPGVDASTPLVDAGPLECADGTTRCGTECVSTSESRRNCGACGNACAAGEACVDGECGVLCPSSQTECGGTCADLATDRSNCGECGNACGAGQVCADGECAVSCPEGQVVCGGVCADLQSSHANCGECGNACAPGAVCNAGHCEITCGGSLAACDGACVSLATSPDHCGACGNACPAVAGGTPFCSNGSCRFECSALQGDCNGIATDGCETPLATDVENCGGCGIGCELADAVAGCSAGECVLASCDAGFDDCDGAPENGCEAELATDALNCGACGTVCGVDQACVRSTCIAAGGGGAGAGDRCESAIPLTVGTNTITWEAATNDYLRERASCSTSAGLNGPDIVLSYTAPANQALTFTFHKANSASSATSYAPLLVSLVTTCGDPDSEIACLYASTLSAAMQPTDQVVVPAGTTVYVHVIDSGTASDLPPLPNPLTVDVTATQVACAPGIGGVVGNTQTDVITNIGTVTADYLAVDDEYFYVGDSSAFFRAPRAGGSHQDIEAAAGLTSSHLGAAMAIHGDDIYMVEATTSSTVGSRGRLFRISRDGGVTWRIEDYADFFPIPADDFRSAYVYGDKLYLLTEEDSTGVSTEIWSVDLGVTLDDTTRFVAAVQERVLSPSSTPGMGDCNGLTRDATYFYLACVDTTSTDTLFRVPVAGGAPEVMFASPAFDINSSVSSTLRGGDTDADGTFDVLYLVGAASSGDFTDTVQFVCEPAGPSPTLSTLANVTGMTGGLAIDPATGALVTFDDSADEFVVIQ
ncbi:Tryptophan synthase alpha chain [Sandaracinus amylolyticus]|uniref:Tryptophan synthase alpha chain n=1 Tax=Sandaracinus amylolyticus TaxID=927083 RepID=A0A0F6W5R9_9BACT|nr:Tryptophan synthase alpha chain [Sandaracinus amylolyticus]